MKFTFTLVTLIMLSICVNAQDLSNPGTYMDFISIQRENISKKFMSYASASAHGKRAKKVENLRQKLLTEVQDARSNISGMSGFKGDKSYRDTAVTFMKLYYNILNDDYSKILNLEEIAENSYDEMEALILVREGIDAKLETGNAMMKNAEKTFAKKYNVNLVEGSSTELADKLKKVNELNDYYNDVYMLFFKPHMQEKTLLEAMSKNNITGLEQSRSSMKKYATEGIEKLKTIKSFEADNSVTGACKSMLQFYIRESDAVTVLSDFILAKEAFEKMKKAFEKNSKREKADVDAYNKAVNDLNIKSNNYNRTINELNKERNEKLNLWNKTINQFFDEHTPRYK